MGASVKVISCYCVQNIKQTQKNKEKESAAEKVEILSDVIMDVRVLLVSLLWAVSCVVSNS